jgi:primosomal protein N' (replication factor Y)
MKNGGTNRKFALVGIPKEYIECLIYEIPPSLKIKIGDMVEVSLKDKIISGIVIDLPNDLNVHKYKIKPILHSIDINVPSKYLEFLKFASNYYCVPLGASIKAAIPSRIKIQNSILENEKNQKVELPTLSIEQKEAFGQLVQIIATQKHNTALLHGVTGSGKTAVYMHLVQMYLMQGKQVLILLPEIGLTAQILATFTKAFNTTPTIWHSQISEKNKSDALQHIIKGTASIIIGVRSALFLPYKNLELIIVDEEHDPSYKQENYFCYNARDMAVLRGFLCKTFVLLGSATPSTETYQNVLAKKYALVTLSSRFANAKMPKVEILNMQNKNDKSWLCAEMYEKISNALSNNNQVLLFLNKRGYAPLILCSSCGLRQKCNYCSSWLVLHKTQWILKCHHCNHSKSVPNICPNCAAKDSQIPCGPGIERIAEELQIKFGNYKIAIASRDNPYNKAMDLTLRNFTENKVDILIGTQIITKGHHFPNLTMVGVVDADVGFSGENIRTLENTFQLLHQVGGRSGREQKEGLVCIQTYFPNSKFMQLLKENDFISFIHWELDQRKKANLPPFSKAVKILISSSYKLDAEKYASNLRLNHIINDKVKLFGPVDARIAQINKENRIKMLLVAEKDLNIKDYIDKWMSSTKKPSKVRIKIDVDPYDLS